DCPLPVENPAAAHPVVPQLRPADDFGPPSERFSFERVSRAVAEHFWTNGWDPLLESALHNPEAFAGTALEVLGADFLTQAIRPLVESMQPVAGLSHEAAYQEFCRDLLIDGLDGFARSFPVSWQRVRVALAARVAGITEAVRRLTEDHSALSASFGVAVEAQIVGLSLSGDTHSGGRAVSVVEYSDGTKIVYKPRPVDSEAAYAKLTGFLNRQFGTDFQSARVRNRTGYGYVEFVPVDPAAAIDLHRVGELAALLYALNARDMHFTNILSTATGPVPIDLETLLHPHRQKSTGTTETAASGYRRLESSVFGTGVLPLVVTKEGREGYVDVGYLGGGEVRGRGPFRTFRVLDPFRADMRVVWDDGDAVPAVHRDQVGMAAATAVRTACDEMVAGFSATYQLLLKNRVAFERAVQVRFAGAELRYIHNATVQYGHCLRMLTGSAAGTDPELARGLIKRIGIASRGADTRLVESECAQLWASDVPFFLIRADGTEITDGSPDRAAVASFEDTPLDQLHSKLDDFSEADLARQVQLIRVAFNAKLPDPHVMSDSVSILAKPSTAGEPQDQGLREIANRLGRELVDGMVEDRYAHLPRTWIGPVASAEINRPWPPGVLGYDLYTGRVGPALALAALGNALGEQNFRDAAAAVFVPAAEVLTGQKYELRSIAKAGIGAYNGFAGTVWAMAAAGRLLDNQELVDAALLGRQFLGDGGPQDRTGQFDPAWFDTVSGGLGALLVRQALGDDPAADAAAVDACTQAVRFGVIGDLEYSGMAHGLAGLLHFAARTYGATGDDRAAVLAGAVQDELDRQFLGSGSGYRTNRTGQENYSDSWCNGTAGILVAQSEAASAGLADDARLTRLLDSIHSGKIATSLTLCHGMLGLYDALALVPGAAAAEAQALRGQITAHLDPQRIDDALQDTGSRYNHSPALMVGRAGVAWHLASRLTAEPLPSPLSLAPLSLATRSPADSAVPASRIGVSS
ncbi:MAG: type 2 lanthipeptide synthetase LanM, partial [Nakamurella sp.]